ncbi:hypothetical protein BH11MYX4_BH11MYX4_49210 [soil metagenome]
MKNAPLYRSETRSVPIPSLPSTLRNALLTHADKKKLKMVAAHAWLTHRENPASETMFGKLFGKRSNRADPDASHDMLLVLHATHLLVGTSGVTGGTKIRSLSLLHATAKRGSDADAGLTIGGFPPTAADAPTYFMGLGAGPAAEACVLAVLDALDAAKRPAA